MKIVESRKPEITRHFDDLDPGTVFRFRGFPAVHMKLSPGGINVPHERTFFVQLDIGVMYSVSTTWVTVPVNGSFVEE